MANLEHLEILKQGVEAWNNWRAENLEIEPDLSEAYLFEANLRDADLSGANLSGADLYQTQLVDTNLTKANLSGCSIYGISAWDLQLSEETIQSDLVITPHGVSTITVDYLEVAQFIYLLLRTTSNASTATTA